MSTHTHTDQSGTYTHVIDGDTYTVTSEDGTWVCALTAIDTPETEEIDFQVIDSDLSLGVNEIAYKGTVYSIEWN